VEFATTHRAIVTNSSRVQWTQIGADTRDLTVDEIERYPDTAAPRSGSAAVCQQLILTPIINLFGLNPPKI